MQLAPEILRETAARVRQDIDDACADLFEQRPRRRLGASDIGGHCAMRLYLRFRWAMYSAAPHNPRMLRLFDRGHKYEADWGVWLAHAGYTVYRSQEGDRYQFSAIDGHFGGEFDYVVQKPTILDNMPLLTECKTHNTRQFLDLRKNGVQISHPSHFDQASIYGRAWNLPYTLYLAINKNDDDTEVTVFKNDFHLADSLHDKAKGIIYAQDYPAKVSRTPAHVECKGCSFREICHEGAPVALNCRTCSNSVPYRDGDWFCNRHNAVIPREVEPKGCDYYSAITQQRRISE